MTEIPADVVEVTWRAVAGLAPARAKREMSRLHRAQPALMAYVLAATEELSPRAHELGVYLFFVVWRIFENSPHARLRRITPGAIERRLDASLSSLAKLEGADPRFLERAAHAHISRQPHVARYVVEALMEAPDDPDDPVDLTHDEQGQLFIVLSTAIELLTDAG